MRYDPLVERRSSIVPALVLGAMAIGGVLSLTTMLSAHPNVDTTPIAKIAPTARWTDRPITEAGFVLEVAEFTKAPPEYLAEIQPTTGNLRDTLILGDDRRFIRLTIQRQSAAAPQQASVKPADFYVEMVRRSADAGLAIARAGRPARRAHLRRCTHGRTRAAIFHFRHDVRHDAALEPRKNRLSH